MIQPTIIGLVEDPDPDPDPDSVLKSKKGRIPVSPVVLYGVNAIVHSYYSFEKG
jgi:hypothetical protein